MDQTESYKHLVHHTAREALGLANWKDELIGTGKIIKAVLEAIEIKGNNLADWQARYGDESRSQHCLHLSLATNEPHREILEQTLFDHFKGNDDEASFYDLMDIFGKKYRIIAYLFFLKNRSKYMPLAASTFEVAFEMIGIDLKLSHKCSWENYQEFNALIEEIRKFLSERLNYNVELLDTHSFLWVLGKTLNDYDDPALDAYLKLGPKEREAVVKSRIGQGKYREDLIRKWNGCSVTNCSLKSVLVASHIKPWSECDEREATDPDNGLLLVPNLDALFDRYLISFSSEGSIIISSTIDMEELNKLGVSAGMKLRIHSTQIDFYMKQHRKKLKTVS